MTDPEGHPFLDLLLCPVYVVVSLVLAILLVLAGAKM